jgi:hypothetical protein
MGGVICCGTPNQTVSYSQYQAHPAPKRKVYRAPRWDGSKSPAGWDGSKSPRY